MSTLIPDDLTYGADHEWVRQMGDGTVRVGISDYAQKQLGDVVYVQLPEPGESVQAGEPCGEVESHKSVSDLVCPVEGEVVEANDALADSPEIVNEDPYGAGWMLLIRPSAAAEAPLSPAEYRALVGES